jgi:hypothetical protein
MAEEWGSPSLVELGAEERIGRDLDTHGIMKWIANEKSIADTKALFNTKAASFTPKLGCADLGKVHVGVLGTGRSFGTAYRSLLITTQRALLC